MSDTPVDLQIEQVGNVTVISIRNPRVAVEMSDRFEEEVVCAVDTLAAPRVLIDFDGVEFISSAILGKLIKLNGRVVTDRQGRLVLCCLAERIADVFKITGLEQLFTICKTRDEALASLE